MIPNEYVLYAKTPVSDIFMKTNFFVYGAIVASREAIRIRAVKIRMEGRK